MSPRLFDDWRSEWRMRRGLASFVVAIMREPDDDDVSWLADAACEGDQDRARWELRYARRALGLLVAQRDALDDRTPSLVSRELATALQSDRNVAPAMLKLAERQFNDRLSIYREVLTARAPADGSVTRLGRTLLQISGARRAPDDAISRAGGVLTRYVDEANEELRKAFGSAALPEDLPPTQVGS